MPTFSNPAPTLFPNGFNLWDTFYQDNPQAGYYRFLDQQFGGAGRGTSPREEFLQGQFGRQYQSYLGALPELGQDTTFLQYLQQHGNNLEQQFRGLDPRQRGERYGYGTGRTRYIL